MDIIKYNAMHKFVGVLDNPLFSLGFDSLFVTLVYFAALQTKKNAGVSWLLFPVSFHF